MSDSTVLYARDARGALRYWSIHSDEDNLEIEYGVVGGEPLYQTKYVEENMSGRSLDDQITLEMNSLISKKVDKGYTFTKEDATATRTNSLGLLRPMLASTSKVLESADLSDALVQYKYDGHRCMIHNNGVELIAYSRNGKPITTVDHILDALNIPDGWTLDGELYCHGMALQTISSMVKREQEANKLLSYQCYDVIVPEDMDAPFIERQKLIRSEIDKVEGFVVVPHWSYAGVNVKDRFEAARREGYEGLIVRLDGIKYESGKRSKGVIKIKSVIDDEFEVVGISASKDGWAVLECVMRDRKVFSVSAPGSIPERHRIYRERGSYIGMKVNVEFANLTKGGKPFHPVATSWRNKDDE